MMSLASQTPVFQCFQRSCRLEWWLLEDWRLNHTFTRGCHVWGLQLPHLALYQIRRYLPLPVAQTLTYCLLIVLTIVIQFCRVHLNHWDKLVRVVLHKPKLVRVAAFTSLAPCGLLSTPPRLRVSSWPLLHIDRTHTTYGALVLLASLHQLMGINCHWMSSQLTVDSW